MNREQKMNAILERQQAGIEAVLVASRSLLEEADSFNIERLETLLVMRSNCIEELAALEKERKSIASGSGEPIDMAKTSPALKVVLENLSAVDERLQYLLRRRQVAIINIMASMPNKVNFSVIGENMQMARQLLDVTR
ncbi:MAG: hypothetical protein IIA59_10610 [Candidatus Marinimicrobia bacterium]|nr:hypothetical protein [Candidatus Neomarinimicrobiota bacterium]